LKDLREANKQTCLRPEINEKKCFDRSVTDRLNSINGLFATKRLWEGGGAIFATLCLMAANLRPFRMIADEGD